MGFSYVGGHMHCSLPDSERPEVAAFVDKFLLGDTTANTNITTNPYDNIDYAAWTDWWGTGNPVFPKRDIGGSTESIFLEAECATVGTNWVLKKSLAASNGYYETIKSGLNSTTVAPADSASCIYFPFTVTKDTTYYVFSNLYCPTSNDDSYWLKLDDGSFTKVDDLGATGWHWLKLTSAEFKTGNHILTISYCEDGAFLDKICISSNQYAPIFKGDTAQNLCDPAPKVGLNLLGTIDGYALENYPNPFNDNTTISFEIPNNTFVSLKVYNMLGVEIAELAGKEFTSGKHTVEFEAKNLSKGIYFCTLKTDNYSLNQKMIINGN